MEPEPALVRGWRPLVPLAAAALAISLVLLEIQHLRWGGSWSRLVLVGKDFPLREALQHRGVPVDPVAGSGYDGQWSLGVAADPLLTSDLADTFDMPRYRAGRPLMGMLAWLLSAGGRLFSLPVALVAVGPLAGCLGVLATGRLMRRLGRSPWFGLGFLCVPGIALGIMHATSEPLGLALAVLGLALAGSSTRGSSVLAGSAFAAAALTKENFLLFGLAAALAALLGTSSSLSGRLGRAAALVGPGVVALGVWQLWVRHSVPAFRRDALAGDALAPPFAGWAGWLHSVVQGSYHPDLPIGPLAAVLVVLSFGLVLWGLWLAIRARAGASAWAAGMFGLLSLCLSSLLLSHFVSSMRALAPALLAWGLALAARSGRLGSGVR